MNSKPHCNYFVNDVASTLGIDGLRGKAHEQFEHVSGSPNWREITGEEAQRLANQGEFVIGVTPQDQDGSGHSTVVAPGHEPIQSGIGSTPWVYDINLPNQLEPVTANYRYFKSNPPRWFVYENK